MSAHLVRLGTDDVEGGMWDLAGGELRFGREVSGERAVRFPPDAVSVSREHARIYRGLFGYVLEDMASQSGTCVNGRRLKRKLLRHRDEITIGDARFRFYVEPDGETCTLAMTQGPFKGQSWPVTTRALVVGTDATASVPIPAEERTVSERHAAFQQLGGKFYAKDLGSRRGTRVNGRVGKKFLLADGDTVEVGAVVFRVRLRKAIARRFLFWRA